MDVLRQGPEVKVLAPASLAARVRQRHAEAAALYGAAP
jgi:predicted DNA-binding transcriptional regulator YafY